MKSHYLFNFLYYLELWWFSPGFFLLFLAYQYIYRIYLIKLYSSNHNLRSLFFAAHFRSYLTLDPISLNFR